MEILGMVRNFKGMLLLVKKMYENEKPNGSYQIWITLLPCQFIFQVYTYTERYIL